MRSSDKSMRLGCSASNRAWMAPDSRDGRAGTRRGHAGAGRLKRCFAGVGRCFQQQPAKPRDGRAQIVAMHHHVDHAMGKQVFGSLKTFRQLLADSLFNDARAGEADQRAGLGDVHVAEHRVRGGDSAGRRIGQNDDIGLPCLLQLLHGDGGARHLHQRKNAFLHARAARGGKQHERAAFFHRGVEALDDRFARGHAERAAHEVEILNGRHHGQTVELAVAELHRVVEAGLAARVLEPIDIAALVAEFQRVGGTSGTAMSNQVSLSNIDLRRAAALMRM